MGHTLSFVVGQRGPSTFCAFLRKGSKYYFDIFCVTFDEHELFSDFEKRVASRFVFHYSKRSQSFFLLGNFFWGEGGFDTFFTIWQEGQPFFLKKFMDQYFFTTLLQNSLVVWKLFTEWKGGEAVCLTWLDRWLISSLVAVCSYSMAVSVCQFVPNTRI